ncbi:MAG: DNA polymerase IV [Gemmatimonadales bacterium]|nr:MAG: DNA polymerase IV [Gemmatimonadales bacterium]
MDAMTGPAPSRRRILLLDCDVFFVQVARLEDPEGAGRAPLLMVGGSASGRGVVTSADYSVREYGVHSGMPVAQALRLCPDATVVPVPREACVRRSRAIARVLDEVAPVVQAASIDEFYLDLTGTERLHGHASLEQVGREIQTTVRERTGITVSVGGGTVRLVAKLAVERAKPGGVHVVPPGGEADFLRDHELARIPGVGPSLLEKLAHRGIHTVEDLLPVDEIWLRRWLGEARGRWLWERVRGIDPSPVDPDAARKSISSERTFPRDIPVGAAGDEELLRHLNRLVLEVGTGLRSRDLMARTITVKLRDADFTTRSASRTPGDALESDRALLRLSEELLAELRARSGSPVRLLGMGVSSLEARSAEGRQLSLLGGDEETESDRDRILSRAADQLRTRFGRDALLPGRLVAPPDPESDL